MEDPKQRLRSLPRVDAVAARLCPPLVPLVAARFARAAIEAARTRILAGDLTPVTIDSVATEALAAAGPIATPTFVTVLNATGTVLHTNLGRAPLTTLLDTASGYSNLELDLKTGARGSRMAHVDPLLTALTGAEGSLIVNNAAAALMIAVATVASGREVIVARGELVEIGDSFRLPDILEAAGVRLREVGTTNRVTVSDYTRAIGPETGAIVRVHPSNFAIVGFTSAPSSSELIAVAITSGIPLIVDLGSDPLTPLELPADSLGVPNKPAARDLIADGADIVLFSGDKEAGGPQCGIIVGRAALVTRMKRHPWMRAMRVDKLRLAALIPVLQAHLAGKASLVPTHRYLNASAASLETRCNALAAAVGRGASVVPTSDQVGGGSHPTITLPGFGLAFDRPHPQRDAATLRRASPPTIARIEANRLIVALRAVDPDDDHVLAEVLRRSFDIALDTATVRG